MQKKIIALAIAAAFAAPVAMAETANVNVYGSLDAGLRSLTTAGATTNKFASGTYNSNRWGIKGSEDLGDGMKTNFLLEGDVVIGTGGSGTTLFARSSTVGVSGGFGAIDLGRQYGVPFKVITAYDPFNYKYIGITHAVFASENTSAATLAASAVSPNPRSDNAIHYTYTAGDVKVMAAYVMGASNTGDSSDSTSEFGVSYASGGISVGGAYSVTKPAVGAAGVDVKYYTAGAAYNFGDGKASIGMSNKASTPVAAGSTETTAKFTWLGVSYNVSSKIGATAAYYKRVGATSAAENTDTRIVAGVTYALSKRTTMYAEADKKAVDAAGVTTDSNGYALGLATTF